MHNIVFSQWLVGTWILERFSLDSEAHSVELMGPNATGYVAYGADGWMSFQIAAANRGRYDVPDITGGTSEQTIAAARSFMAYAGPYTVDDKEASVVQHLADCLIPNWVGDIHKRYICAEGENGLILSSDAFPVEGKMHKLVLKFSRRTPTPIS